MRLVIRLFLSGLALTTLNSAARAQEGPYKAEASKDSPPAALTAPIKDVLEARAIQILGADGKPLARVWLRKGIPASARPAGAKGTILFPFLAEGELIGALEFVGEGHDFRDQTVPRGVYTLRYGLQPVNGDHLGVSEFRDYALLIPAAKDTAVAAIPKKTLEKQSSESAGSNHPTILLLVAAPKDAKPEPATVRDETKNLWGVVLPVSISIKGEAAPVSTNLQLIIVGAAMT
jgi:hypothetical protein